jgi:signal transduction histidine kinase
VKNLSFQARLTLAVCLLVVGMLGLLGWATLAYFENQIKHTVGDHQFALATAVANEIDEEFRYALKGLLAVAENFPRDFSQAQENLERYRFSLTFFDNALSLLSPSGHLLAINPRDESMFGHDYSHREYFQKTLHSKSPHISEPFISIRHGRPIIMLTAPLRDQEGEVEAILVGSIDLASQNFLGKVAHTRIGDTGYLYLFAADRTMIMHPDRSRILQQDVPPGVNWLFDKALQGFEGSDETINSLGIPMLASFKQLQEVDWILGATTPRSDAYAAIAEARKALFVAVAVAVFLSVLIVCILAQRLTNPLKSFTEHVRRIQGKTGEQRFFSREADDEVGVLAAAFNGMLADLDREDEALRLSRIELEGKNFQLNDLCEQLETKNEELEQANADLKESQDRILQQEKMASIGQLAAGVAHEINNPIGFIASNLNSLTKYIKKMTEFVVIQEEIIASYESRDASDRLKAAKKALKIDFVMEDIDQLVSESLDGAERVAKIVQGLKSFAHTGDEMLKPANLTDCLESAISIAWNEIKFKAELVRDYQDLPPILCHEQQLAQVFMNLLVNASHAIEKSGTITVRTRVEDEWASVAIQDNGCGIPPENLGRLFEPFFTTKDVGKGTGLGLSIAYEIVKKHGGDIRVSSEPGCGTTFVIQLPIENEGMAVHG